MVFTIEGSVASPFGFQVDVETPDFTGRKTLDQENIP
jgi:hypothetical protein